MRSSWPRLVVPFSVLVALVARLPYLQQALGNDEAGFLLVGGQWHAGDSLYGNYWVDRPPLLITIFDLASRLGGEVPLRLIGCVAAALVVLGCAALGRRLAGPDAGRWSAAAAAALLMSPLLGAYEVNGELLAAPFVIGGLVAATAALARDTRRWPASAALAGAALVAALLVKQNFADVAVYAGVVALLGWRRGQVSWSRMWSVAGLALAGALGALALAAGWTTAHGTSLTGVFEAMYPFRVAAAHVLAATPNPAVATRGWLLVGSWVASGGALVMLAVAWALTAGRVRRTTLGALAATLVFDVASIVAGGNYWHHYLVQLLAPLAVAVGVVAAEHQVAARTALVLTAAVSVVTWTLTSPAAATATSEGADLGAALSHVALPSDTLVTAWGHADVNEAAGMSSPYPYLWSLPARTLDPRLEGLESVLQGHRAPTWFVVWTRVSTWGPSASDVQQLLDRRYHPVAHLLGRTVYLRDGMPRLAPQLVGPDRPRADLHEELS